MSLIFSGLDLSQLVQYIKYLPLLIGSSKEFTNPQSTTVSYDCWVKALNIKNWGSFHDLYLDLNSGSVTFLIGPGDSGKTNVIRAILFFFRHFGAPGAPESAQNSFTICIRFGVTTTSKLIANVKAKFKSDVTKALYSTFLNTYAEKFKAKYKELSEQLGETTIDELFKAENIAAFEVILQVIPSNLAETKQLQNMLRALRELIKLLMISWPQLI